MDFKSWGQLLVEIEYQRRKLYEVYSNKPLNDPKLIQVSQYLDKLINQYHQAKTPCLKGVYFLGLKITGFVL